jgi:hypothetical protein
MLRAGVELPDAPLQSPCWHLTHDGEPRRETQAESSQRSENCLSDQSQRRDARQTAQRAATRPATNDIELLRAQLIFSSLVTDPDSSGSSLISVSSKLASRL